MVPLEIIYLDIPSKWSKFNQLSRLLRATGKWTDVKYRMSNRDRRTKIRDIIYPWGVKSRDCIEAVIDNVVIKCWQIFQCTVTRKSISLDLQAGSNF